MREKIILSLARLFRFLPVFRGKYRVGSTLQKMLLKPENWKKPEIFIQLKDGSEIMMDTRSMGHQAPFWTGMYDTFLLKKFTSLFKQNWIVLDIGASSGWYSIPMGRALKPLSGILHAFEPLSSNYDALCNAIVRNKLQNIKHHKIALGNEYTNRNLLLAEKGSIGNAVILKNNSTLEDYVKNEMVQVVCLDTYFNPPLLRCDFIKMDIEGFEMYVLYGAESFIKLHRPIIYGEFSPFFLKKNGVDFKEIWDFCQKMDYKIYHQTNPFQNITFYPVLNGTQSFENLLLFPCEFEEKEIKKWIH
jgi:FkbM family methyltransferase